MKLTFTIKAGVLNLLWLVLLFPLQVICQIPSGSLAWKFSSGEIYSAPLVVDTVAYVGDMNGKLSALNANTGKEIWSYTAETYIASNPAFKDGVLIFEAGDRLHGLKAKTILANSVLK